jgi:hypothetical protein
VGVKVSPVCHFQGNLPFFFFFFFLWVDARSACGWCSVVAVACTPGAPADALNSFRAIGNHTREPPLEPYRVSIRRSWRLSCCHPLRNFSKYGNYVRGRVLSSLVDTKLYPPPPLPPSQVFLHLFVCFSSLASSRSKSLVVQVV